MYIPNLELYNIPYDDKLYDLCHEANHIPDEYRDKFVIDPKVIKLRDMCQTESLKSILTYANTYGVPFDRYCLDRACSSRENDDIVQYLLMSGIMPTYTTIVYAHTFKMRQYIKSLIIDKN